jgi:hypothetical protein
MREKTDFMTESTRKQEAAALQEELCARCKHARKYHHPYCHANCGGCQEFIEQISRDWMRKAANEYFGPRPTSTELSPDFFRRWDGSVDRLTTIIAKHAPERETVAPQPRWERQQACPECDGDGCNMCAPEGLRERFENLACEYFKCTLFSSFMAKDVALENYLQPEVQAAWKFFQAGSASASPPQQVNDHLLNLLAVIHRDGGHYVAEHGLKKAVKDALKLSSKRISLTESAAPPEQAAWISVKDRLPSIEDGHVAVMLRGEKKAHAARIVKDSADSPYQWLWDNDVLYEIDDTELWQPLPAPPEAK